MSWEEKVKIANEEEKKIANEYRTIGEARQNCKWGGHCASCMYCKGTVQVSYDIMDRMNMKHDYCMFSSKGEE